MAKIKHESLHCSSVKNRQSQHLIKEGRLRKHGEILVAIKGSDALSEKILEIFIEGLTG